MTTVDSIAASLRDALARGAERLFVDDPGFGSSLRLGQIVKGRVMRQYENGRYGVDFGSGEKVVDSSVPLQVRDLVTAKVIGLGDQVHLQRLQNDATAAERISRPMAMSAPVGRHVGIVQEVAERFQVTLSAKAFETLVQAVRQAAHPARMSLSGVILWKLGVPVTPEPLQAMYRRLGGARLPSALDEPGSPTATVVDATKEPRPPTTLEGIANELRIKASQVAAPEASENDRAEELPTRADARQDGTSGGSNRGEQDARWQLGHWLLNVQSHPRVAHRLMRLPLWVGDQLVEVSIALLSESEAESQDGIRFTHAVLFLELERLGRVQVTLRAADRSLRLDFGAEHEQAVDLLARHVAPLKQVLERLDWQVVETAFLQMAMSGEGDVLDTIVHHHVTQDSLSRWM